MKKRFSIRNILLSKSIFLIGLLIFISSCAKTEYVDRIVYRDNLIYPEIPKLEKLTRPELYVFDLNKYVIDNETLYCLTKEESVYLLKNLTMLKVQIETYEQIIDEYQKFYKDYYDNRSRELE